MKNQGRKKRKPKKKGRNLCKTSGKNKIKQRKPDKTKKETKN